MNLQLILPITSLSEEDDLGTAVDILKNFSPKKISFFDEQLTGYILLEDDPKLIPVEKILKASSINLDFSIIPNNTITDSAIYSNHIKNISINNDDNLIFSGLNESDNLYYFIWKFELSITYPKNKYISPRISLSVSLLINKIIDNSKFEKSDHKLQNFTPIQERNVLSELGYQITNQKRINKSLALSKTQYLPYSRFNQEDELSKNSSSITSPKLDTDDPPQANGKLLTIESEENGNDDENKSTITINDSGSISLLNTITLPVYTMLVIRLRSTKPAGRNNILLSTLDMEASKETIKRKLSLDILKIDIAFQSGAFNDDELIKELLPSNQKFPISFASNDSLNITYRIINDDIQTVKPIVIKIHSKVKKFNEELQEYEYLGNGEVVTNWSTSIDFSIIAPPINNSMKTQPSSSSLARNNSRQFSSSNIYRNGTENHSNYSISPTIRRHSSVITNKKLRSTSSSLTVNVPRTGNSILGGLVLTFKGRTNFKLGEIISWEIQAINNSNKTLNLSLLSHSNSMNSGFEKNYPKLPVSETNSTTNNSLIFPNLNQVYKLYNSQKLQPIGVVCLGNDIRIGPLESKMVFETELKLMALSKGIFSLDGLKIIDVSSGEGFDCGRLLEVVVLGDD